MRKEVEKRMCVGDTRSISSKKDRNIEGLDGENYLVYHSRQARGHGYGRMTLYAKAGLLLYNARVTKCLDFT